MQGAVRGDSGSFMELQGAVRELQGAAGGFDLVWRGGPGGVAQLEGETGRGGAVTWMNR